jgi:hypothetical protein
MCKSNMSVAVSGLPPKVNYVSLRRSFIGIDGIGYIKIIRSMNSDCTGEARIFLQGGFKTLDHVLNQPFYYAKTQLKIEVVHPKLIKVLHRWQQDRKIKVMNLAKKVDDDDLRFFFTQFGEVDSAYIIYQGGASNRCGYLIFSQRESVIKLMEMEEIKLKNKHINVMPLNQDYTPFLRVAEEPVPTETSLCPSGNVSTNLPEVQSPTSQDCGNSQNNNIQVTAEKNLSPGEPIYDGPYTKGSDVYYYYDYEYKPDYKPDPGYDCDFYYAPEYNQQILPHNFETAPQFYKKPAYAGYQSVEYQPHAYADGYGEYYTPETVSSGYGYAYDGYHGEYAPKNQVYEYYNQGSYSNAETSQY